MMIGPSFLRSANIAADLGHPERFAHFRPTSRSARIIDAVAFGRPSAATMVIAAYGSGKSLAAGVGALAVGNEPRTWSTTLAVADRLATTDPELARRLARRPDAARGRGLAIALHGHVPSLGAAIVSRAGLATKADDAGLRTDVALDRLTASAERQGLDRIAIVWDEFGRHLEGLVAEGRAADLLDVQTMAEWAVRQDVPRATLTLLLHQSLLSYAGRLGQGARAAWRKIEGRFEILRFVEDSRELHGLIGRLMVDAKRAEPAKREIDQKLPTARRALELGWFRGFDEPADLARLMAEAAPFTPGALYVLPLVAARIAQQERSVFTFIDQVDLAGSVGIEAVYRHFSEAMRGDTGLGGTHRRWLETESARSRAGNDAEREILAATCLLQLGVAGERRRLSRTALAFAVVRDEAPSLASAEAAIDALLERKLLLHRLRNDDISVWHGADVDVRGRLEAEKARLQAGFDLADFLRSECPPPVERPLRHNLDTGVGRFFPGSYARVADLLRERAEAPVFAFAGHEDGRIIYALAETVAEIEALVAFALDGMPKDHGLVLVVPRRPLEVADSALELAALLRLRADRDLIDSDPLVLPELNELTAAAREDLARQLASLTNADAAGAEWFAAGECHRLSEARPVGELLSILADRRFSSTPRIINEQVVRRLLSRPMVNARKKAILGILERDGSPSLGFAGLTTPDASIVRTVLERTGLYAERPSGWGWGTPGALPDLGLDAVWTLLQRFWSEPTKGPVAFTELLERLHAPPFGLRPGVVPVLLAASMRAFARAVVIRRDGTYLADILASEVEAICAEPDRHTLEVVALPDEVRGYLEDLTTEFRGQPPRPGEELIRAAFDAITAWRTQLPESALGSTSGGGQIATFQVALKRASDPVALLLHDLPAAVGASAATSDIVPAIGELRRCLDSVVEGYARQAIAAIGRILTVGPNGHADILSKAKAWADCFGEDGLSEGSIDVQTRGLLTRAAEATNGRYTEASFARALSAMLVGRGFERWDDKVAERFVDELRHRVERIERAALTRERPSPALVPLLRGRIEHLVIQLRSAIGDDAAASMLERLLTRGDAR